MLWKQGDMMDQRRQTVGGVAGGEVATHLGQQMRLTTVGNWGLES